MGFLKIDRMEQTAAKPYYERALAISEKPLGAAHVSTETVRNHLAWLTAQMQSDA